MSKRLSCALVVAGILVSVQAGFAQGKPDVQVKKLADNLVEVTALGMGMDKDEAVLDAKRKAIEYGAGSEVFSHSEVKDFALAKDTIIARAAGFVQSFEIIGAPKTSEDGVVQVRIKAIVSVKGIEDTWGVVQNFLKTLGKPKIMVFIKETADGKVADDSTVQTKIENLLLKSGFILVDKNQIKEIDRKDLAAAVAEDKPDRAQAVAKRFGAQLFITGSVDTQYGGSSTPQGILIHKYGAKGNIRCFRSDTAQLMSSQNGNEMSADRMRNVAGDKALGALGDKLGPLVQNDVLRFWLDVTTGGGEVQIKVDGLTFKQNMDLKKALKEVKGVTDVAGEFANNTADLKIQTTLTAEKLAEKLVEAIPDLDITDVSANVIKGAFKKK